ncbi:conserved hypothetical protein [Thermoplasma acidophilum]|uniref:UPF0150 protein Ta0767 n=1 Tax=Thermoplasma acidophilum (strain ATCC 25905 / DSM 1728 / JCM 9062 / NBRC 15155 / AMRC-C165) TaxID=273075 RepID=Y767_THEAC|nr:type II toxin-antitoxin system HicB family antitoxin [Thermoplasma acidophilum]Q9HK40.1 RecName: Full=UPF0150 protein Ta0767 [Thermoplasma acidophilum DSM 1728]CAC11899.1 conserved hypothetical protein [Thermoplasma acidophilum]
MKYTVIITKDEDGYYVVNVPALPGCFTQGKTKKEALINIKEAIRAYIESLKKHNEKIPRDNAEEITVHA